jgi:hypothetical protein
MLLLTHIISALLSIAFSTFAFFAPTKDRIRGSYRLVVLTLLSGTIIIIKEHVSLLSVCLSGLLYIGYTVSGLIIASKRLAKQEQKIN